MCPAICQRPGGERRGSPDMNILRGEREAGRHYTDDGVLLVIENNLTTQQAPIAAESSLPQTVTDERHMLRFGAVLISRKTPAEHRLDAQHLKQVVRRTYAVELFGFLGIA